MFEIEAGCSKNFTEDLYSSMNSFLDGNITLEEFLDDIEQEYGYRTTLIILYIKCL